MPETETVTYRQWEDCAARIECKNLRETGRSLTRGGIERRAQEFIVAIHDGSKTMVVFKGWRQAMRTDAPSPGLVSRGGE